MLCISSLLKLNDVHSEIFNSNTPRFLISSPFCQMEIIQISCESFYFLTFPPNSAGHIFGNSWISTTIQSKYFCHLSLFKVCIPFLVTVVSWSFHFFHFLVLFLVNFSSFLFSFIACLSYVSWFHSLDDCVASPLIWSVPKLQPVSFCGRKCLSNLLMYSLFWNNVANCIVEPPFKLLWVSEWSFSIISVFILCF